MTMRYGFRTIVDFSERFEDLTTSARRWNAIAREALREELELHHQRRIPAHFSRSARTTYRYAERTPGYKALKKRRFGSLLDLVKTGRSKSSITRGRQIRFAGTLSGSARRAPGLTGSLVMKMNFPLTRNLPNTRIKGVDLANEIGRTTNAEQSEIVVGFARRAGQRIRTGYGASMRRAAL